MSTNLVVPAQVIQSSQPQLTKSLISHTSYPEPCIVCEKHQCEWDILHAMSYPIIEAINSKFDSVEQSLFNYFETPPD